VARDLKTATSAKSMGLDVVKDAASKFEKWDPLKNAAKPTPKPAAVVTPAPVPEPSIMGPATQALADQQAAKRAIAAEAAEKMRAVTAPVAAVAEAPVKKPRAPRKKADANG
jgi:sec-independent protein translocase protein TatB